MLPRSLLTRLTWSYTPAQWGGCTGKMPKVMEVLLLLLSISPGAASLPVALSAAAENQPEQIQRAAVLPSVRSAGLLGRGYYCLPTSCLGCLRGNVTTVQLLLLPISVAKRASQRFGWCSEPSWQSLLPSSCGRETCMRATWENVNQYDLKSKVIVGLEVRACAAGE